MLASISVQEADFDPGAELAALSAGRRDVGALANFVGLVRDANDGSGVSAMTLEHYPGMTEKALQAYGEQAARRWDQAFARAQRRGRGVEPRGAVTPRARRLTFCRVCWNCWGKLTDGK